MADVSIIVDKNGTEFTIADAPARADIAALETKTRRTSGTASSVSVGDFISSITLEHCEWYKSGGMCFLFARVALTTTGETPEFSINDAPTCTLAHYFGTPVYKTGTPIAIDGFIHGATRGVRLGFKNSPISGTFGFSAVYPVAESEL